MIGILKGKILNITTETICVDVGGVGYELYVDNSKKYHLYDEVMVYTYLAIRENGITLFGFFTKDEKDLFMKLISVKGVGPKISLGMLSKSNCESVIEAIESGDIDYLKKLPGIGSKVAGQIILDLKGHLKNDQTINIKENLVFKEAKEALKNFGFKNSEIDTALIKIQDDNIDTGDCVFKALQYLNKK